MRVEGKWTLDVRFLISGVERQIRRMAVFTLRAYFSFFKLMVRHCINKGRGEALGFRQVKGDQTFDHDPGPSYIAALSPIFCQADSFNLAGKRDCQFW
jgi:hypothetical protein